jgi:hypothetical protein
VCRKVATRQVFIPVFRFSPAIVTPPVPHISFVYPRRYVITATKMVFKYKTKMQPVINLTSSHYSD